MSPRVSAGLRNDTATMKIAMPEPPKREFRAPVTTFLAGPTDFSFPRSTTVTAPLAPVPIFHREIASVAPPRGETHGMKFRSISQDFAGLGDEINKGRKKVERERVINKSGFQSKSNF